MDVTVIYLGRPPPIVFGPGEHVHWCPRCYEPAPCTFACSCDVDQTLDDGTPCGATADCDRCLRLQPDQALELGYLDLGGEA